MAGLADDYGVGAPRAWRRSPARAPTAGHRIPLTAMLGAEVELVRRHL